METEKIVVESITDNNDGTSTMVLDLSEDVQAGIIRSAMADLLEELKADAVVAEPLSGEYPEKVKTYELTDEDTQFLMEYGVRNAITRGLNGSVKKLGETWEDFFNAEGVDRDGTGC